MTMPDESLIANFDPFDIMDKESARLSEFFGSLDAAGWKTGTRCEGWTRREMIAHLASGEAYTRACLDDALQPLFEEGQKAGATDLDGFNDWAIRMRADRAPDDVLAEWQEANANSRAGLRRRGRGGTMTTSVGPYPVGWQAFYLASEYAIHADDMDVPVPDENTPDRRAWRLAFGTFALQEQDKPVTVDSRNGKQIVRSEGRELILSDDDFIEATAGRLKTIDDAWQQTLRALA